MESNFAVFEKELITEWLKNMESQEREYNEPILDSETASILRNVCRALQQDTHVFLNSLEILDEYIQRKK